MLEVTDLHKRLGGTIAVNGCSVAVEAGERVVLLGPNGAGKSTLIRIIAGVLSPDRGVVHFDGKPLTAASRGPIGYVPEAADPPGHLSVSELLHLVAATKGCGALDPKIIARLQLDMLLGASISELSLGQRRRACLAAALVGGPRLLLLDEPTNGLDAEAVTVLAEILTEDSERAVLLATHDRGFAERVATRQLQMQHGVTI